MDHTLKLNQERNPACRSRLIHWVGRALALVAAVACVAVLESMFFAALVVLVWLPFDGALPTVLRIGSVPFTLFLAFYVLGASTTVDYDVTYGTKYEAQSIEPIAGLEIECRVSVSSEERQLTPGFELSRWHSPNGVTILIYDPEFRVTRGKITDATIHDDIEAAVMAVNFNHETRMFDQPQDPVDGWVRFQHGWNNAGGGITRMQKARCGLWARSNQLDSFDGDKLFLSFTLWLDADGVVTSHSIRMVILRKSALGTRVQLNFPT